MRGNHDKACSGVSDLSDFNPIAGLAALWTREKLTHDHLEFLRELPHGPISPMENVQLVHGSPRDEDEYVLMASDAYAILQDAAVPLTFFGHTHVQRCLLLENSGQGKSFAPDYKSPKGKQTARLEIKPKTTYMVNPGSVGQPRDGDPRAAFLLYDTDAALITFYRVPYDIQARTGKNLCRRIAGTARHSSGGRPLTQKSLFDKPEFEKPRLEPPAPQRLSRDQSQYRWRRARQSWPCGLWCDCARCQRRDHC